MIRCKSLQDYAFPNINNNIIHLRDRRRITKLIIQVFIDVYVVIKVYYAL